MSEKIVEILNPRDIVDVRKQRFLDEGIVTKTVLIQLEVEDTILKELELLSRRLKIHPNAPQLFREQHIAYLKHNLSYIPTSYQCLDASRPWLCYWILHGLSILGVKLDDRQKSAIAKFLGKCQHPEGGFGGGPGQIAHLAPTYAAVNALVILGTEEAYNIINRSKLHHFLWDVKQPDGSFSMHRDGEVDIRGVYCALSAASLTNTLTEELCKDTYEWIISCQTYEGGFSGAPGMEAHGGYSFCGLSALTILKKEHLCDMQALLRWTVNRQMKLEGGFQGRTNKLVDGCYSFWQGAVFPQIYNLLAEDGYIPKEHLFDERALQEYVLGCCQKPQGGLLDKPGKHRDIYHTSYTLSGLSIAQHFNISQAKVLSDTRNEVDPTHPVYNIRPDHIRRAFLYFGTLELPSYERRGT